MKTKEQLVQMQEDLRLAMMSMKASMAPPEAIERSSIALGSAHDVLNWVLGKPSELDRLEEEYNRKRDEISTAQ
jgi:hypothetical protein